MFCFCLLNCSGLPVLNYLLHDAHTLIGTCSYTHNNQVRSERSAVADRVPVLPFITPHTPLTSLLIKSSTKAKKKKHGLSYTLFHSQFPRFFFFLPICLVPWSVSFLSLFLLHSFALKSFALFLSICSSPPPFTPLLSLAEL